MDRPGTNCRFFPFLWYLSIEKRATYLILIFNVVFYFQVLLFQLNVLLLFANSTATEKDGLHLFRGARSFKLT